MLKKTLVAAALAGALTGSALAANVSLYGVVDEGLFYKHQSVTDFTGAKDTSNNFTLDSSVQFGSRWGLKGTEELGNGYAVSFKLESGFNADDGTLLENRLFRREVSLTLTGPFGALSAGRLGGVGSAAGTYDVVFGTAEVFDGLPKISNAFQTSARYDNILTYQTPKFAGLQATTQYSFKKANIDAKTGDTINGDEGKSTADRYASFALTGEYGNLKVVAAYERQIWSNTVYTPAAGTPVTGKVHNDNKDQNTFYLGGNYDFGVAKVFALGQYFTGARTVGLAQFGTYTKTTGAPTVASTDGFKGFGAHVGTIVPTLGGNTILGLYYVHAKADDASTGTVEGDVKTDFFGAAARYVYPLSKRTSTYVGLEYGYQKVKLTDELKTATATTDNLKQSQVVGYVGLTHAF